MHAAEKISCLSRFRSHPRLPFILLCIAFTVIWFAQLNIRHLIPSDEGRYAEIAREMLVSGDWITPHYNGYVYFEKPPLQMWMNAATFAAFGVGDWQARLYTALTSFLGVLLIAFTGTRMFNARAGFFAAVVLATAPYWNLVGHFNTLDMGLSFWMAVTLCAFLLAQRPNLSTAARRGWMGVCWASMAIAVLSKGLIGVVLPGAVLIIYTLIARDWALWRRLYLVRGLLILIAIALPWFVLVQMRHASFFDYFFITQHFRRYLMPEQHRDGGFYYFFPVMLIGFLPWVSAFIQSLPYALKQPRQSNGFSPVWLLIIWSVFIFTFFSLSHSKLISYVLPLAPAIALLIGVYLPQLTHAQWHRHFIGSIVWIAMVGIGTLLLLRAGDAHTPAALYRAYWVWVMIALAIALISTVTAMTLNKGDQACAKSKSPSSFKNLQAAAKGKGKGKGTIARQPLPHAFIVYACGWFAAMTIAGNAHEIFGRASAGIALVPAVKSAIAKMPADTPFYSVGMLDHTLPFYLRHTMILVEHPDELAFSVKLAPHQWVPTVEDWIQRWQQDAYALALIQPSLYLTVAQRGVPMHVIARDNRRVIVEKVSFSAGKRN